MEELTSMGIISIIPALLAIALSFRTKNTIVALAVACITGTVLVGIHEGQGLVDILLLNFPTLLKENLGTTSFSWVMLLNTMIGILVAYFQKTGAIQGFSQWVHDKKLSRKGSQLIAWVLGMFVYFSDSFSPLFVGCTMRSITDKARISREKLAYIADSTSAPVSVLVPITGWAAYLSGLAVGVGCIATQEDASALFIKAIPFNFYALFAVAFVGLIASGIVKDFGPMKKAEKRAMETGKVLADSAQPLTGKELTSMEPYPGFKPRVFLNFLLPVLVIITVAMSTYAAFKSAKTMEAFTLVVILMSISMMIQGIPFKEVMDTLTNGIKGALPAVILLALAYSVNGLSKTHGYRKLHHFGHGRSADAASAAGSHLHRFRYHGVRYRFFLGHVRNLHADRSAACVQHDRRPADHHRCCGVRSCCRRRRFRRPLLAAVRYHHPLLDGFGVRPSGSR